MPRNLTFRIRRSDFTASPRRIDRRKLYGWSEIEATDDAGAPCAVVRTDETGRLMLPRGAMAVGLLGPDGEWVERNALRTVGPEGAPAALQPSIFDAPVVLSRKATEEELLEHDIEDFYLLADVPEAFRKALGAEIYTFSYCYAKACEGRPAFVLATAEGVFLLVGRRIRLELAGYDEPGFIDDTDEDEAVDEEAFDFAMF